MTSLLPPASLNTTHSQTPLFGQHRVRRTAFSLGLGVPTLLSLGGPFAANAFAQTTTTTAPAAVETTTTSTTAPTIVSTTLVPASTPSSTATTTVSADTFEHTTTTATTAAAEPAQPGVYTLPDDTFLLPGSKPILIPAAGYPASGASAHASADEKLIDRITNDLPVILAANPDLTLNEKDLENLVRLIATGKDDLGTPIPQLTGDTVDPATLSELSVKDNQIHLATAGGWQATLGAQHGNVHNITPPSEEVTTTTTAPGEASTTTTATPPEETTTTTEPSAETTTTTSPAAPAEAPETTTTTSPAGTEAPSETVAPSVTETPAGEPAPTTPVRGKAQATVKAANGEVSGAELNFTTEAYDPNGAKLQFPEAGVALIQLSPDVLNRMIIDGLSDVSNLRLNPEGSPTPTDDAPQKAVMITDLKPIVDQIAQPGADGKYSQGVAIRLDKRTGFDRIAELDATCQGHFPVQEDIIHRTADSILGSSLETLTSNEYTEAGILVAATHTNYDSTIPCAPPEEKPPLTPQPSSFNTVYKTTHMECYGDPYCIVDGKEYRMDQNGVYTTLELRDGALTIFDDIFNRSNGQADKLIVDAAGNQYVFNAEAGTFRKNGVEITGQGAGFQDRFGRWMEITPTSSGYRITVSGENTPGQPYKLVECDMQAAGSAGSRHWNTQCTVTEVEKFNLNVLGNWGPSGLITASRTC
ncbi:MAG: hypothetical protein AB7P76_10365 [Candidatus Melainabacteria bacterium]